MVVLRHSHDFNTNDGPPTRTRSRSRYSQPSSIVSSESFKSLVVYHAIVLLGIVVSRCALIPFFTFDNKQEETMTAQQIFPSVYSFGYHAGQAVHFIMDVLSSYQSSSSNRDGSTTMTTPPSLQTLSDALWHFPAMYATWWINLVKRDPIHVAVETTLLLSIVYILWLSSARPKERNNQEEKLTVAEENELLNEWKQELRTPLTPLLVSEEEEEDYYYYQPTSNASTNTWNATTSGTVTTISASTTATATTAMDPTTTATSTTTTIMDPTTAYLEGAEEIIVHKYQGKYMTIQIGRQNQGDLRQVLNMATFDFLGISTSNAPSLHNGNNNNNNKAATNNTNNNKAATNNTSSKDMTPESSSNNTKGKDKKGSTSNGSETTAASPSSASSVSSSSETLPPLPSTDTVKEAALASLDRYGCGSCGPRGFYGTIDTHLQLESAFSEYCGTEQAILYSDGASTCSSTIAAFAKRGDLLVVDEGVYEPLMTGVTLSRAHVKWFKHNDMDDLRKVLESIRQKDKQLGRKPNAQRRFIVVEGLYKNTGTIVPLEELVKLKHEFCYRLILDESFSFGSLGKTGRGVVELYQKRLMHDAEIVTVGLENSLGSIGGLTIGTDEVVDHQRLSGSGYCFSASVPPFTASAAMASLQLLKDHSEQFIARLDDNRRYMYERLKSLCSNDLQGILVVTSDERSPIVVVQVAENNEETEYLNRIVFFAQVARESLEKGVAFVATGQRAPTKGPVTPTSQVPPALRIVVTASHTRDDIDHALAVLKVAVNVVMELFREENQS